MSSLQCKAAESYRLCRYFLRDRGLMLFQLIIAIHAFAAWNVNDLSILLPLPKAGEEAKMIGPSPELLPQPLYNALPNLLIKPDPETVYNGLLKVIAIRFDHCFREGDSPCQKQVRLVWQPILFQGGKATTLDGAIHTFHSFSDEAFASLVEDLEPLRLESGPATLGVHPTLAREGYGPFWEKLKKLITKHCTEKNLVRAAMMTSTPRGVFWTFTSLDIVDGQPKRAAIPRIGAFIQSFFTALKDPEGEFRAGMNPEPPGEQSFVNLLRNSEEAKTTMTERSLIAATKSALKAENPRLSNPGTLDCASCHAAHLVPLWTLNNFGFDWDNTFAAELFARLDPSGKREPAKVLRAFGYFEDRPVISRRMANEATETAAQFTKEKI